MINKEDKIRDFINKSSNDFLNYLGNYVLDRESFSVLMALCENHEVYILSGVIRDFFLGKEQIPRDLDFVLKRPYSPYPFVKKYLKGEEIKYSINSFKGLKIKSKKGLNIDVWLLENTWGIKNQLIKKQTPNALLDSVFFNFSAILYDLKNNKFIYEKAFVEFLKDKVLDVVYEENPNIPLCLFNVFHYAITLKCGISNKLKNWIKLNYNPEINFEKVQSRHLGEVLYASKDIHKFLKDRTMKSYNLDWAKYLSEGRVRKSESKLGEGLDKRNHFESDFGRVVFSSALRRMHDKAQVIPLTSGDIVHTRLTHSIEVMNTAQSLATNLCRDSDFINEYGIEESADLERKISAILKTAAFVHDIGNPPFGHFGEAVIQNYFRELLNNHILSHKYKVDFEEFDGNAQGFRILTKLSYVGHLSGLNLTYATLAAYLKYPNVGKPNKDYIGTKKHGVFTTEENILNEVVKNCNLRVSNNKIKRHPLSFLVEAADSICYNVMDIEDGYVQRWYDKKEMIDFLDSEITDLIGSENKLAQKYYDGGKKKISFLKIIHNDPQYQDKMNEEWNHSHWIVSFRTAAIQYLVEKANINFKAHIHEIEAGSYTKELIEDDEFHVSETLQNFTRKFIFPKIIIEKAELTGHSVIRGLLDILIKYVSSSDSQFRRRVKSILSKSCMRVAIHESKNEEERNNSLVINDEELSKFDVATLSEHAKLRLVVDFISGMTDKFAVQLYQELSGHKI